MKFLVDAQLSIQLAQLLQAEGHDTLHTYLRQIYPSSLICFPSTITSS